MGPQNYYHRRCHSKPVGHVIAEGVRRFEEIERKKGIPNAQPSKVETADEMNYMAKMLSRFEPVGAVEEMDKEELSRLNRVLKGIHIRMKEKQVDIDGGTASSDNVVVMSPSRQSPTFTTPKKPPAISNAARTYPPRRKKLVDRLPSP